VESRDSPTEPSQARARQARLKRKIRGSASRARGSTSPGKRGSLAFPLNPPVTLCFVSRKERAMARKSPGRAPSSRPIALLQWRTWAALSQQELAALAGLSYPTISRIKLATALKVAPSQLFNDPFAQDSNAANPKLEEAAIRRAARPADQQPQTPSNPAGQAGHSRNSFRSFQFRPRPGPWNKQTKVCPGNSFCSFG
jgi:hypothetical protein